MGSESGGSAVDSVAGEHSGNVPCRGSCLLGQRVGTKQESLPGSWGWFLQRKVIETH